MDLAKTFSDLGEFIGWSVDFVTSFFSFFYNLLTETINILITAFTMILGIMTHFFYIFTFIFYFLPSYICLYEMVAMAESVMKYKTSPLDRIKHLIRKNISLLMFIITILTFMFTFLQVLYKYTIETLTRVIETTPAIE